MFYQRSISLLHPFYLSPGQTLDTWSEGISTAGASYAQPERPFSIYKSWEDDPWVQYLRCQILNRHGRF